ncbi:MAG: hypothetical protein Q4D98_01825 [Planctomycetia bacterium]|nr:hypothetical protein [Planctomycetia bacterium]
MKRLFRELGIVALLLTSSICGVSAAEEDTGMIRSASEQAFSQLTSNAINALNGVQKVKEEGTKGVLDVKFQIAEVNAPSQTTVTTTTTNGTGQTTTSTQTTTATTPSKLGIKVWFELADGTIVNPTKKEWKPKERFYVHVQTAVPVYVALFQNYPDSRPTSRQIYPNAKYPDSFKALQPGQTTKLPVLFEMDDDMRDEVMSMVVVRADWEGIQNGLTAQATASVVNNNGTTQVSAQVTTRGVGTMKSINDSAVTKEKATADEVQKTIEGISKKEAENIANAVNAASESVKFQIVGSEVATSSQPNDVCFYMFGAGNVGQWQLTIKK